MPLDQVLEGGVATDGVEKRVQPQRLRADQVTEANERDVVQKKAPAVSDGLYIVPKVLE